MNKNILVWILAGLVVAGIVVFAVNQGSGTPTTDTSASSTTPEINPTSTPPAAVLTPGAPQATTDPGATPTASTAVVSGKVYANGAVTSYWFEYGKVANGAMTKTPSQIIGSAYINIPTPAYITGLTPNT